MRIFSKILQRLMGILGFKAQGFESSARLGSYSVHGCTCTCLLPLGRIYCTCCDYMYPRKLSRFTFRRGQRQVLSFLQPYIYICCHGYGRVRRGSCRRCPFLCLSTRLLANLQHRTNMMIGSNPDPKSEMLGKALDSKPTFNHRYP